MLTQMSLQLMVSCKNSLEQMVAGKILKLMMLEHLGWRQFKVLVGNAKLKIDFRSAASSVATLCSSPDVTWSSAWLSTIGIQVGAHTEAH
jgi:hypothetical protein